MKPLQLILEECVTALANDTCTMDECLARYPQYARQLEPLLRTAGLLTTGHKIRPSLAFKSRSRTYLTQHLRFNPRYSGRMQLSWRVALALVLLLSTFFVTGTVQAQAALPGDNFYPWKRASEEVWRTLSIDPVNANMVLANRRLNEWIAVANDPALNTNAEDEYQNALSKLASTDDMNTLTLILPVLQLHQQMLNNAGLPTSEINSYLAKIADFSSPDDCAPNCGGSAGGDSQNNDNDNSNTDVRGSDSDPTDPCLDGEGATCGQGDHGKGNPVNGSDHANCNAAQGEVDPSCYDSGNDNDNNNGNGNGNAGGGNAGRNGGGNAGGNAGGNGGGNSGGNGGGKDEGGGKGDGGGSKGDGGKGNSGNDQ